MLDRLRLIALNRRASWRALTSVRIAVGRLTILSLNSRARLREAKIELGIGSDLVQVAAAPFALVLVVIVGLHLLAHAFPVESHQDFALSAASLFSTIAGVTGVFLALYFAAVTAVAGSVFGQVPADIRTLLSQEKVGSTYVRFLSFLTCLALVLLGELAVGLPVPMHSVALMIILCVPGVFSFAALGRRAFHFFDPTQLGGALAAELNYVIERASRSGSDSLLPGIDRNWQRRASVATNSLATLVQLAAQNARARGESRTWLAGAIADCLTGYLRAKRCISSKSSWYALAARQRRWRSASSAMAEIAWRTETLLSPEMKPDRYWLEDRLLRIVEGSMENSLAEGEDGPALGLFTALGEVYEALGGETEMQYASNRFPNLSRRVIDALKGSGGAIDESRLLWELGLLEGLLAIPPRAAIGLLRSAEPLPSRIIPILDRACVSLEWNLVMGELPAPSRDEIERIGDGVRLERRVEGYVVSPEWYLKDKAYFSIADRFVRAAEREGAWAAEIYPSFPLELGRRGHPRHSVFASLLGIALCSRLEAHAEAVAASMASLPEARAGSGSRPTIDTERVSKELSSVVAGLDRCIVDQLRFLAAEPDVSELPDLLGSAFERLGRACVDSLAEGDKDQIAYLFPKYFESVLVAADRLKRDAAAETTQAEDYADLLTDLTALSGIAFAWSEFHSRPELWAPIKETWERWLMDGDAAERRRWLRQLTSLRPWPMRLRAMRRSAWARTLDRRISALPVRRVAYGAEPEHPSSLIRALGSTDRMPDGQRIFADVFLPTDDADESGSTT